ncbi:hypothetical protein EJB05_16169, partial [Eragrostis curvula]
MLIGFFAPWAFPVLPLYIRTPTYKFLLISPKTSKNLAAYQVAKVLQLLFSHNTSIEKSRTGAATMATVKVYVLLFTALFFSGLMQLSMAQDKPATATARVVDATAIDQAIAYVLMFAALFVTYFAH